jgi:hypothetical protein
MSEPFIDDPTHGAVLWLRGCGPAPVQPYTGSCEHWGRTVIADGWDFKHYELVQCDLHTEGSAGCGSRAWTDPRGVATTTWMQPTALGKGA